MSESLQNHVEKLTQLYKQLDNTRESKVLSDAMLHQLERIIDQLVQHSDAAWQDASSWLANAMSVAPQIAPMIDRELLWFFGGDCLHYLTDEEIDRFQRLEESEN